MNFIKRQLKIVYLLCFENEKDDKVRRRSVRRSSTRLDGRMTADGCTSCSTGYSGNLWATSMYSSGLLPTDMMIMLNFNL